jgi:hypothetical protein
VTGKSSQDIETDFSGPVIVVITITLSISSSVDVVASCNEPLLLAITGSGNDEILTND